MTLPKPYYDDGRGIVIYNADCREILPLLEPVDLVLTDPPYGINYQSNMRSAADRFSTIINDDTDMRLDCYGQFKDSLNPVGIAIIFCSFKNYAWDYIELAKHFDIKNCVIWDKGGVGLGIWNTVYPLITRWRLSPTKDNLR